MKTILILRHAKSSWKDSDLSGHDRPLNKRGKREAPQMGQLLKEKGLLPEVILSSTARRARDTAQIAAENCSYDGEIRYIPDLYRADVEDILGILQGLEDRFETAMLVGHNPELEMLLSVLSGEEESLTTAALAQVELPIQSWKELDPERGGKLVNLVVTILAGYALSRKDLVGKNFFMFLFAFTMLFNGGIVPTYLVVNDLGLINSRWALIIPQALSIWNLIITVTYFRTSIPVELLENRTGFARCRIPKAKCGFSPNRKMSGLLRRRWSCAERRANWPIAWA